MVDWISLKIKKKKTIFHRKQLNWEPAIKMSGWIRFTQVIWWGRLLNYLLQFNGINKKNYRKLFWGDKE